MKLSIITAVYNQEELLKRCINSIPFNEEIESIIINDGSTDNTAAIIEELTKTPNVFGYSLRFNKGVSAARNIGLDVAKGQYIMILDSDDYIYPENFKRVYKLLDGYNEMIYYNLKTNDGRTLQLTPQTRKLWCGATKFIKRDFIEGIRYPENMRRAEDWYFNELLLSKKPFEVYTGLDVVHYNWPRPGSLTAGG